MVREKLDTHFLSLWPHFCNQIMACPNFPISGATSFADFPHSRCDATFKIQGATFATHVQTFQTQFLGETVYIGFGSCVEPCLSCSQNQQENTFADLMLRTGSSRSRNFVSGAGRAIYILVANVATDNLRRKSLETPSCGCESLHMPRFCRESLSKPKNCREKREMTRGF